MDEWGLRTFEAFFEAAWQRKPFAWQTALAQRVLTAPEGVDGAWPEAIVLPTASGKTACMDVAVFSLAASAGLPGEPTGRRAPRRIFFVVDRRVIVDEAFDRAQRLARVLAEARSGILREVGDRLRHLAGSDLPLAVQALRGGQPRGDDWAATPLQPTIVASTVDQVGSRLLFRAYGPLPGMWPVHAGLVGNDALILLDEAHCAQPMLQTLRAVRRYRLWAERALNLPFEVSVLSATPPQEAVSVFRDESDDCLDPSHPLGRRQQAAKPARLVPAPKAKGRGAAQRRAEMADALAKQAWKLAEAWRTDGVGAPAVVVFCNRVDTAQQVSTLLRKDTATVHLLTGRMRPIDKDDLVATALAPLATSRAEARRLATPTFIVATQTLEVGADLDFDLLVSECASLDALRQRFGRLNRSGRDVPAAAAIVAAAYDIEGTDDDPVYGAALRATWVWLNQHAQVGADAFVDFGIAALEVRLPSGDALRALNAPSAQAPVMLPAYLDLLVQTAPVPEPSPDLSVFLHGPSSGAPDVQVCWRADLTADNRDAWVEALVYCPPSPPECLTVPYQQARRWLDGQTAGGGTDVEAMPEADAERRTDAAWSGTVARPRLALRWRGRDASQLIEGGNELRPGDLLVLPAEAGGWNELGTLDAFSVADWGDRAHAAMRRDAVLRLHRAVIAPWLSVSPRGMLDALLSDEGVRRWVEDPESFASDLRESLRSWASVLDVRDAAWLRALLEQAAELPHLERSIVAGPCGGWIVRLRRPARRISDHGEQAVAAFFDDGDDASSSGHYRSLLIETQGDGHSHLSGVGALARHFAQLSGLPAPLVDAVGRAGDGHDLGKADPRFQSWLRNGMPWIAGPLLAKSDEMPQGPTESRAARARAGYPKGGRHELLSVRLLESCAQALPSDADLRDLVLHLVESHHGHCRPLAPVVDDPLPVTVALQMGDRAFHASSRTDLERLDAGPADRFWRLTRRYGWWGLAWLESLLRLADHRRSEWEQRQSRKDAR